MQKPSVYIVSTQIINFNNVLENLLIEKRGKIQIVIKIVN